jgi:hypothetical protein
MKTGFPFGVRPVIHNGVLIAGREIECRLSVCTLGLLITRYMVDKPLNGLWELWTQGR